MPRRPIAPFDALTASGLLERRALLEGRGDPLSGGDGEGTDLVGHVRVFRREWFDVTELDIFGGNHSWPFGTGAEKPAAAAGDA